jgi:hypothetical protein
MQSGVVDVHAVTGGGVYAPGCKNTPEGGGEPLQGELSARGAFSKGSLSAGGACRQGEPVGRGSLSAGGACGKGSFQQGEPVGRGSLRQGELAARSEWISRFPCALRSPCAVALPLRETLTLRGRARLSLLFDLVPQLPTVFRRRLKPDPIVLFRVPELDVQFVAEDAVVLCRL